MNINQKSPVLSSNTQHGIGDWDQNRCISEGVWWTFLRLKNGTDMLSKHLGTVLHCENMNQMPPTVWLTCVSKLCSNWLVTSNTVSYMWGRSLTSSPYLRQSVVNMSYDHIGSVLRANKTTQWAYQEDSQCFWRSSWRVRHHQTLGLNWPASFLGPMRT